MAYRSGLATCFLSYNSLWVLWYRLGVLSAGINSLLLQNGGAGKAAVRERPADHLLEGASVPGTR